MTLRQYLILMTIGALICWCAWFFVLKGVDPSQTGALGFLFFYVSLFLSLTGTISVAGFLIRKKILKQDDVVFRHVKRTFRQGILISCLLITYLFLLQVRLLKWWNGLLLLALFLILEGIVFTSRKFNNKDAA